MESSNVKCLWYLYVSHKDTGRWKGYLETYSCQTCSFGLARVPVVYVCALVLCKLTSDKPESANGYAGYFKKSKFQFGIHKECEIDWLFLG